MKLTAKRILIAPYTPTTKALENALLRHDPSIQIVGYIDNYKLGRTIHNNEQLDRLIFDYILVLSPNHFNNIFDGLKRFVNENRIVQVVIVNYQYKFVTSDYVKQKKIKLLIDDVKFFYLRFLNFFYDLFGRNPSRFVFIAKSFVGSNTKAFYLYSAEQGKNVTLVTDNNLAYNAFKDLGYQVEWLGSWKSFFCIASSNWIIQDQANHTEYFDVFSKKQKTLQMWHGIPLKKLSPQHNITYDLLLSTSSFVSKSSLASLFLHHEMVNSGYPRNDLFTVSAIKNEYLLTDQLTISWVQQGKLESKKILVYMPTHREYDVGIDAPGIKILPLEWSALDQDLSAIDALLVLKLHPVVEAHYQKLITEYALKSVKVYPSKQDIYPLLRDSDLLITDYSSVYFDYLLLNKPIVFYCYDFDQYADNKDGWTYPFEAFTPGDKIYKPCYTSLIGSIKRNLVCDFYADERNALLNQLFEQKECYSEALIKCLV